MPMHTSVAIRCHRSLFANHSFSYILMCHFRMGISCERLTTISSVLACTVYSLYTTLNTLIRRYNLCRQTMLFVQSITESILVFATTVFACASVCMWVTFFFLLLLVFVLTVVYIVCVFFFRLLFSFSFDSIAYYPFLGTVFFAPLRRNGVAAVVCQDDDDYALMSQTASYSNWLLAFLWTFHNSIFYFVWSNWMAQCALFQLILI